MNTNTEHLGWVRYREGSFGFRAGQWARVVRFSESLTDRGRAVVHVWFTDGVRDFWPLLDYRHLEFSEGPPRETPSPLEPAEKPPIGAMRFLPNTAIPVGAMLLVGSQRFSLEGRREVQCGVVTPDGRVGSTWLPLEVEKDVADPPERV